MPYKTFISYSHAADGHLAPMLESALQRFAKPWYRRRAMRVFRDETSLRLTPELWPTIQKAIGESEHFVLMASPAAAASKWVRDEITEWLKQPNDPRRRLFIVLTDGEIVWDVQTGDFDWTRTTALPPELKGVFAVEPFYLDFNWVRGENDLTLRMPRFLDGVSKLAAALHGVPLDELAGEDLRQHRILKTLSGAAITLLVALAIVAAFAAVRANAALAEEERQRKRAESESARAVRQELVAIAEKNNAIAQTKIAREQTKIANEQRQTAEERRVRLQQSYSDTEFRVGNQLLARGDTAEGVAHLARALTTNPSNASAADRLYTLLAMRDQPVLRRRFRATGAITAYDISADGREIATVTSSGRAILWNADGTRKDIQAENAREIRFLGDDTLLIIGAHGEVLRANRSGRTNVIGHLPSGVTAYAATSERVAGVCGENVIAVLPLREGATATTVPFTVEDRVDAIGFVRNGAGLLVISGATAQTFDFASGKIATERVESSDYSPAREEQIAAIAPSGTYASTYVDTGGLEEEAYVAVDVVSPEGAWPGDRESDTVARAAAFNDAGTLLAVTLTNDAVHLLTAKDGELVLHHENVIDAAPHPKRDIVYTASSNGSVMVWDPKTGKPLAAPLWHPSAPLNARFASDANVLAVLTADGAVSLWDLAARKTAPSVPVRVARASTTQPEARFVLRRKDGSDLDDDVAVWQLLDAKSGQLIRTYEHEIPAAMHDYDHYHGSARAVMSADGTTIIAIAGNSDPVVWSTSSPKPLAVIDGLEEARDVLLSPHGDRALIVYSQNYALYSLPAGKLLNSVQLRTKQKFEAVSPSFDRVIVSEVTTAWVRDIVDGHTVGDAVHHEDQIHTARFSNDGRTFCTASRDGTVRIWDTASGFPLSEPLVFDSAPPRNNGAPNDDDYLMNLGYPALADNGRRVSFPDPASETPREFAWNVSLPVDAQSAQQLAELATLVFGARIGSSGGVEHVPMPEAAQLRARFARADAIANLADRVVGR